MDVLRSNLRSGELTARRAGGSFCRADRAVTSASREVEIVLAVAPSRTVTVRRRAAEQPVSNVAASVQIVDSEQIKQSPASSPTMCSARCRRSAVPANEQSVVASTSQGVVLRALSSGRQPTLVLLDGIPFNDTFGGGCTGPACRSTTPTDRNRGRLELEPVRELPMGGVINLVPRRASRRTIGVQPAVRE